MFFSISPTVSNRQFFLEKLNRHVIDLLPGVTVIYLDGMEEEESRLAGIVLTANVTVGQMDKLAAVEVSEPHRIFLEELLKRKVRPITPTHFHVRLNTYELHVLKNAGIKYDIMVGQ